MKGVVRVNRENPRRECDAANEDGKPKTQTSKKLAKVRTKGGEEKSVDALLSFPQPLRSTVA